MLVNKRESTGLKYSNNFKVFIEYSNVMVDIYKSIEGYNLNEKRKTLIAFNYMIADMLSEKHRNPKVTELFIRDRKLNISYIFIKQSYFVAPKKY